MCGSVPLDKSDESCFFLVMRVGERMKISGVCPRARRIHAASVIPQVDVPDLTNRHTFPQ